MTDNCPLFFGEGVDSCPLFLLKVRDVDGLLAQTDDHGHKKNKKTDKDKKNRHVAATADATGKEKSGSVFSGLFGGKKGDAKPSARDSGPSLPTIVTPVPGQPREPRPRRPARRLAARPAQAAGGQLRDGEAAAEPAGGPLPAGLRPQAPGLRGDAAREGGRGGRAADPAEGGGGGEREVPRSVRQDEGGLRQETLTGGEGGVN